MTGVSKITFDISQGLHTVTADVFEAWGGVYFVATYRLKFDFHEKSNVALAV
jgi:hypothetical protein